MLLVGKVRRSPPGPDPHRRSQTPWCESPPPLDTPLLRIPAGQRPDESDQHRGAGPNLPSHSRRTSTPPVRLLRVCTGHRSAAEGRDARLIQPNLDTPMGYIWRPLTRVSAVQGPFQHVVAGEGFEPSKLSRWIYRRKRLFHRQLTCAFRTNSRRQPGPTGHFWACTRSPWSRWRPGSAG